MRKLEHGTSKHLLRGNRRAARLRKARLPRGTVQVAQLADGPAALSATQNTRMADTKCADCPPVSKNKTAHARVEDDTFGAAVQASAHEQRRETNDKRLRKRTNRVCFFAKKMYLFTVLRLLVISFKKFEMHFF